MDEVCFGGGVCSGGVSTAGGVYPTGVCPGGGESACLPGGMHLPLPPTEYLTHACENTTFPQLRLRTVNMLVSMW